ncbi:hypothetical protein BJX63DRAFT_265999 [Aspergillus granulosus]|uniref:Uncharacterized protein n=1 Tax=Aspergillus granulosus TaxID=176169 RepID=A0ABR4HAU6_9EURO
MERLHIRIPYTQWRLEVFRQLFSSSNPLNSSFQARRAYSTGPDETETTFTTKTKQHSNHKRRNNDSPETSKRPSELLPQSPLITHPRPGPAVRHLRKRVPTAADLSRLEKNPWAMAIATPIRHCVLSGARIPKAFLTDWGVVDDTPSSAPALESGSETISESVSVTDNKINEKKVPGKSNIWLLPVGLLKDKLTVPQSTGTNPLKLRMIDQMSILQLMTPNIHRHRNQKTLPITRLIPARWKTALGGAWTSQDDQRLCWRPDMPEFVLWSHRTHAMKSLQRVTGHVTRYDLKHGVWTSIDVQAPYSEEALVEGLKRITPFERMGDGAVLVLGNGDSMANLPEYITIPALGSKVPIFDFTRLFSKTELEEIRGYDSRFQEFAVFFRPANRRTVDAVLALWKLQGYIREIPNDQIKSEAAD